MDSGQDHRERPLRRARILVVDDDPTLRRVVEMLLSGRGWVVETACDGRAALESLQDRIPDLVVMDVVMPGIGGLGALRQLRAESRTRRLPVILMSVISEDDARNTLEYDDYYAILPAHHPWAETDPLAKARGGKRCPDGFRYTSDTNTRWLTEAELRRIAGLS